MVPTHSHCAGHSEIERLARGNCGAAVVCAFERGGAECGSSFGKKRTGVLDGTGGRTGGILPITGQVGGPEEAVRERVPSTGIGSSYIRNRSRNVGDSRIWRYEGTSARYDDKG